MLIFLFCFHNWYMYLGWAKVHKIKEVGNLPPCKPMSINHHVKVHTCDAKCDSSIRFLTGQCLAQSPHLQKETEPNMFYYQISVLLPYQGSTRPVALWSFACKSCIQTGKFMTNLHEFTSMNHMKR